MNKTYLWLFGTRRPAPLHTITVSCALLLASPTAFAQSKVLHYDSQGRVISADQYGSGSANKTETPTQNGTSPERKSSNFDEGIGDGPQAAPLPKSTYESGEVLVLEPSKGFEGRAAALGYRVIESISMKSLGIRMLRLSTPKGISVPDAIKRLSREFPGVTFDANTHFGASAGPKLNGPNLSGTRLNEAAPKNPRTARMLAGWQNISPTCGKGIRLGMIDSGVDLTHPALQGQSIAHHAFTKPGRASGTNKHGTAIANILAGKAEWGGLLPGAKLYSANMFEMNEKGKMVGSAVALIKAMEWMANLKVDAVNLSIAGDDNKLVRRALDIADRSGLLLVASVGSWGNSSRRAFPASYSDVIAVTAMKGEQMVYKYANTGPHIDFAAPGTGIWAARPGGGGTLHYGTSFAVPYITATAGILKNAGRTNNARAFRKLLSRVVKDLGAPGHDDVFGYGALNVRPSCKS